MRTALILALALALPLVSQTQKKPGSKRKSSPKVTSMTGCVDQKPEGFFLTDDKELKPVAKLLGDDPERASFAKYMGQKVTVTGEVSKTGELPEIQVREIKKVSDVCAPP